MKALYAVLILLFTINFVYAHDFLSPQDKYVNDFAGILNSSQTEDLRYLFSIVEENTTAEVVFVSLDSIDGEDISQYSFDLGSEWGIGKEDKDNGLLILYVKDINKIWVATGYGLEGILPDSKIGRLLDENYVPLRDGGDVANGILAFSYVVSEELVNNSQEIISGNAGENIFWSSAYGIIFSLLIIFIIGFTTIFSLFSRDFRSYIMYPFLMIFYFIFAPLLFGLVAGKIIFWGYVIIFPVLKIIFLLTGFDKKLPKNLGMKRSSWGGWTSGSGGGFGGGGGGFGGGSFGGGGAGR